MSDEVNTVPDDKAGRPEEEQPGVIPFAEFYGLKGSPTGKIISDEK